MKRILLTVLAGLSIAGIIMAEEKKEETKELERITLGGGCFWCVEAVYLKLDGVQSAISGYMGGHVKNPTYEDICTKKSGHIEVVQVNYDPEVISPEEILAWFWKAHDPTTKDRQGNDSGPQYASAVFYEDDAQKKLVDASLKAAQADFKDPIVTHVKKAETFYSAEGYHQNYYDLNKSKNPYCKYVIAPKLKKLKLD